MKPAFKSVIDVSQYQGQIKWQTVKDSGIDAAYIRLCNGTKLDTQALRNARACRRLGIPFGFYCYWHPQPLALRQAKMLVEYTRSEKANLIPMLDVEAHDDQKPITIVNKLAKSVEILTKAFGKPPTIYTGYPFWSTHVKSGKFSHCPLWIAKYPVSTLAGYKVYPLPVDPAKWGEWALGLNKNPSVPSDWSLWSAWQFSAIANRRGKLYGMVSLDLDLNIVREGQFSRFVL